MTLHDLWFIVVPVRIIELFATVLVLPVAIAVAHWGARPRFLRGTIFVIALCRLVFSVSAVLQPDLLAKHWVDGPSRGVALLWVGWLFPSAVPQILPLRWLESVRVRHVAFAIVGFFSLVGGVVLITGPFADNGTWSFSIVMLRAYWAIAPGAAFVYLGVTSMGPGTRSEAGDGPVGG